MTLEQHTGTNGFATEMTDYTTNFLARCDRGNWVDLMTCDDIDECEQADQPCENGATCNNMEDHYTCSCSPNHYGIHCNETHNDCSGNIFELCAHGDCVELNRTCSTIDLCVLLHLYDESWRERKSIECFRMLERI